MNIHRFIHAVLAQDDDAIRSFFYENAHVNWHCSNEQFTVDEFIRANCEYPGKWDGEIERIEMVGDLYIAVTHVYPTDRTCDFHAVSFIRVKDDRILSLDEYWANDSSAPQWRLDMHIGKPIR